MFNLPLWLLLIRSGRGFKAISRHTRLLIPLQSSLDVDIHVIKHPLRRGWKHDVFSQRRARFVLPKIETLRWHVNSSNHRCLNPCERGGIWLPKKEMWGRYKPWRCVYCMSERRGKFQITEQERKWIRNWKRQFPLFPSFVCTVRINVFPTVRVFFHADWSTAGLSQQLDEWGDEGWIERERMERSGGQRTGEHDRQTLTKMSLVVKYRIKIEASFEEERRERDMGVGMNKKTWVPYLAICRVCYHAFL